jgi:hypothetical protein
MAAVANFIGLEDRQFQKNYEQKFIFLNKKMRFEIFANSRPIEL